MSLEEKIAALWQKHAETARQRAALLERAAADPSPEALAQARESAHKLAGALGSLGQAEAGREAQALEELLARDPVDRVELARRTARLQQLLAADA